MEEKRPKPAIFAEPESYDWNQIVDDLNRLLRLRRHSLTGGRFPSLWVFG